MASFVSSLRGSVRDASASLRNDGKVETRGASTATAGTGSVGGAPGERGMGLGSNRGNVEVVLALVRAGVAMERGMSVDCFGRDITWLCATETRELRSTMNDAVRDT